MKNRGSVRLQSLSPPASPFVSTLLATNLLVLSIKSSLSLIVQVNVVLNRTVVVDSDWRFDNLCGSHLQSQSELYQVSWWYYTLVIDLIGQLRRDVIGRLSVKPWGMVTSTIRCWTPLKDETSNWLGLCDMYNVFYRLPSTSYFRNLVY